VARVKKEWANEKKEGNEWRKREGQNEVWAGLQVNADPRRRTHWGPAESWDMGQSSVVQQENATKMPCGLHGIGHT
jgi:hypothetical protein